MHLVPLLLYHSFRIIIIFPWPWDEQVLRLTSSSPCKGSLSQYPFVSISVMISHIKIDTRHHFFSWSFLFEMCRRAATLLLFPDLPSWTVARVSQLEIADAKFPPEQKWATKNAGFPPPQYSESSRRSRMARLDLRNAQSYLVRMPLTRELGFMVVKLRQQKRKSCWTWSTK